MSSLAAYLKVYQFAMHCLLIVVHTLSWLSFIDPDIGLFSRYCLCLALWIVHLVPAFLLALILGSSPDNASVLWTVLLMALFLTMVLMHQHDCSQSVTIKETTTWKSSCSKVQICL